MWQFLLAQLFFRVVLLGIFVLVVIAIAEWNHRRPIKHYPERHICGECSAPWVQGHQCNQWQGWAPPPELHREHVEQGALRAEIMRRGPGEVKRR